MTAELLTDIPLLILAGGKATRLRHLSVDTPKYLMPVGPGKTFADVHLTWARQQGFRKVILGIGYLGDLVQKYCGDGSKWELSIDYIDDGAIPLGTGGATQDALKSHFVTPHTRVLCVTYGDTLLNFNVAEFVENFAKSGYSAAMSIYKNQIPGHICNVLWKNPEIIYDKLNPKSEWQYIDYGFLAMKLDFIRQFSAERPLDLAVPLSQASYQGLVSGYPVAERFWEIGSPEALEDFQAQFRS